MEGKILYAVRNIQQYELTDRGLVGHFLDGRSELLISNRNLKNSLERKGYTIDTSSCKIIKSSSNVIDMDKKDLSTDNKIDIIDSKAESVVDSVKKDDVYTEENNNNNDDIEEDTESDTQESTDKTTSNSNRSRRVKRT